MIRRRIAAIVLALGLQAALMAALSATAFGEGPHVTGITRYVATTGSDASNDCSNSGSPCATIQHAIDSASFGDVVEVAAGTYPEHIAMRDGVSVHGQGWDHTIIDGQHSATQSVVEFVGVSSSTVLSGVQIYRGGAGDIATSVSANLHGGGIDMYSASPSIVNTWVNSCTARYGGGVYVNTVDSATPILDNVPVSGCQAERGGGCYVKGSGGAVTATADPLVVTEGAVVLNSATIEGGGLYIAGDPAVNLTGLYVWRNTAIQGGGGMYIHYTSNRTMLLLNHISDNTVTGPSAKGAGVSAVNATDLEMMGNLIDLNDATGTNGQGGGVFFQGSAGLVQTNWIINNTAADEGGGGAKVRQGSTGLTIRGNWFQGNSATVGSGLYLDAGAAPTVDANTFVTNTADVGGGIALSGAGAAMLTNNIVAQNTASNGVGGGVWVGQSPGQIINNTIADNTGDGVWFTDADGVAIVNNIIAENSGHEIERDDVFPTTVYTAEYNCLWDNSGGLYENIDPSINDRVQDPQFVGAGMNLAEYYHIQDTSPVSEAGSTDWAPMHDIDWDVRLLGGGVSMGADEIPVAEEYHNSLPLVMKSY